MQVLLFGAVGDRLVQCIRWGAIGGHLVSLLEAATQRVMDSERHFLVASRQRGL